MVRVAWKRNQAVRLIGAVLWDDGSRFTIRHRVYRTLTRAEVSELRNVLVRTRALDAAGPNCELGMDGQT